MDSNEASKAPKIANALMENFDVIIDHLSCGDYLFIGSEDHRPLLVERKTVTDFMGSIKDRLIPQLKCLKEFEEKGDVCLLFEGWMGLIRKRTKWKNASASRFLESVALVWRVPIIPSADYVWTIEWFKAKAKSMGKPKEKKIYSLRPSARKWLDTEDQARYLLEGIRGIGPKKATFLLEKFGSIRNIVNASREDIEKVIGVKATNKLIEVIEFSTE